MAEQLISVGFGKETFKTSSASLSAFVVEPEFQRTLPSKKYKRQGVCQRFPVSLHPEINGYLYLDSVMAIPDGTVILLQSSHRYRGSPIRDGALFIACRTTGPMLTVNAQLPSAIESTISGGFLVFQGRGDILTKENLAMHGIRLPSNYANGFLDEEEVAECYTITEMSPGTEGRPRYEKVENRDGEAIVVRSRPGRKISLRRPT